MFALLLPMGAAHNLAQDLSKLQEPVLEPAEKKEK